MHALGREEYEGASWVATLNPKLLTEFPPVDSIGRNPTDSIVRNPADLLLVKQP